MAIHTFVSILLIRGRVILFQLLKIGEYLLKSALQGQVQEIQDLRDIVEIRDIREILDIQDIQDLQVHH